MKVICISGKARHGKDTVAEMLQSHLEQEWGFSVLIIHYADLLKWLCEKYFGWDGKKDNAGRTLLQHVGTDVVRKQNPNYWVDFVISFVSLFKDEWDYVIIPDCRFPNEVDCWKSTDFDTFYFRVERPDYHNGLSEEQKAHPSETALDTYEPDLKILNDGDLSHLDDRVKRVAEAVVNYDYCIAVKIPFES